MPTNLSHADWSACMPPHVFQNIVLEDASAPLTLKATQTAPRAASVLHLAFLALLAAVVVLPQLALAGYAMITPGVRSQIAAEPMAAFQLFIAFLFWLAIFLWPLKNLVMRLTAWRHIEISGDQVIVTERRAFARIARYTLPLEAFRGLARNIRSSLSGTRHELVLVHPDPQKNLLLLAVPATATEEIDRLSRTLNLPEVPARDLYPLASLRLPIRAPFRAAPA